MRNNNAVIILIVGIVFSIASYFMITSYENTKKEMDANTISIDTTYSTYIKDGTTMYTPLYHYVVNNKTYFCKSKISTSIKPSNTPKKIFYKRNNPNKCLPENGVGENLFNIIFAVIWKPYFKGHPFKFQGHWAYT